MVLTWHFLPFHFVQLPCEVSFVCQRGPYKGPFWGRFLISSGFLSQSPASTVAFKPTVVDVSREHVVLIMVSHSC